MFQDLDDRFLSNRDDLRTQLQIGKPFAGAESKLSFDLGLGRIHRVVARDEKCKNMHALRLFFFLRGGVDDNKCLLS